MAWAEAGEMVGGTCLSRGDSQGDPGQDSGTLAMGNVVRVAI